MKQKIIALLLLFALPLTLLSCGLLRDADDIPQTPVSQAETSDESLMKTSAEIETAAESLEETSAETETAAPESKTVTFLAVGDNVIHPNLYTDAANRASENEDFDFKPMYRDVAGIIAAADIAFINQETIFGGDERGFSGYPCFNTPSKLGIDLADIGFDIINIANNHMCDMGSSGYENALDFYDKLQSERGVLMTGGYRNADDYNTVRYIERNGLKIAILGYTYGTNGISLPASSDLVVPYLDEATVEKQLEAARTSSDFVIVSVHWGEENTQTLTEGQKSFAKLMADCGADVIIGHHPHVLQKAVELDNMYGTKTLCIYSLGNFTSSMMYPANMTGGIFTFDIVFDGVNRPKAENAVMTPTVFYYSKSWYDTNVYLMSEFTDELAASHGTAKYGYPCTVAALKKAYTDVIEQKYRPEGFE